MLAFGLLRLCVENRFFEIRSSGFGLLSGCDANCE
jgi:hypothetical protein